MNITNGKTWWLNCTIHGDTVHFGCRVKDGVITESFSEVAVSESMRVAPINIMEVLKRNHITPRRMARMLGMTTQDVADLSMLARGVVVPGAHLDKGYLVTRQNHRVRVGVDSGV